MFSDRFMQRSIRERGGSSSKAVLIPKRRSAPTSLPHPGPSLLRQQSLPPQGSLLLVNRERAPVVVLKPAASPRHTQQSIPCKGSPKPPLLERSHTVQSVPPVVTHTRPTAAAPASLKVRRVLPRVTDHGHPRRPRARGRSFDRRGVRSQESRPLLGRTEFPYSLSATHSSLVHGDCRERTAESKTSEACSVSGSQSSAMDSDGELSCSVDDEGLLVFEEELTDLDDTSCSSQDSLSEDEDDLDFAGDWADQDPLTCVQQTESHCHSETNAGHCHSETNAGYRHSETNAGHRHSETNADALGEMFQEMTLVAEIERRRERDFGASISPPVSSSKPRSLAAKDPRHKKTPGVGEKRPQPVSLLKMQGLSSSSCSSGVMSVPVTPRGGDQPSPPLTASLFPRVLPPTIHFPLPHENYVPLPKAKRALLKWKMSTITPNIVKTTVARAGFSKWSRGSMWIGYWGKHMREQSFKTVKEYQKVNHFPGTFQIGRKDRLWRNLSRMQIRVGRRECDFIPLTFVLPQDLHKLKKEWDEGPHKQKWILKPPAAARGIGVRLAHKWTQIPKKRPVVVQRYISDPFLINGSKFDLRVYVYVACYDPLKVYVFKEGLARFATTKYSSAMKHLSNKFMHLTNYSINKHNVEFTPNTDEKVCQGHKWGLLALWDYMETHLGLNTTLIWQSIKDVVVKTIICSEPYVSSCVKAFVRNSDSVHELFGFDIMLDRRLKPWLLEVNISPSLHSNSQLDINIKGRLVRDLFNISGFTLPSRGESQPSRHTLSTDERIKHSHFAQRNLPQDERRKILDHLTPHDVLVIMKSEDELLRRGQFERVYPTACDEHYRKFFETERYNNILLCEWAARYQRCPKKGHLLLSRLGAECLSISQTRVD